MNPAGHESHVKGESLVVPTGFPSIDHALNGGLKTGSLSVIGGDYGAGTSTLTLDMALRHSRLTQRQAYCLSTQALADDLRLRCLELSADADSLELDTDVLPAPGERAGDSDVEALPRTLPLVETLLERCMDRIQAVVVSAAPGSLLVIDALEGLLERDHELEEALAWTLLTLKRAALHSGTAILLTAHLPGLDIQRADRRPRLSDFGLGGAVSAHADLVLGLFREELYDSDLGISGAAELHVLKDRRGAARFIDLYYDSDSLRFEDMLGG